MSEQPPPSEPGPPYPPAYPPLTAPGSTPAPGWGAPPPVTPAWGTPPAWGAPPPAWGQAAQAPGQGWGQPWAPPVHKPGIIALRPLGLGDIYDGAFKAIRRNPKAMLGMSVALVTGFLLLPSLLSVLMTLSGDLVSPFSLDPASTDNSFPTAFLFTYGGQLLAGLAGLMLTGMIVHIVAQAVLGRHCTSTEAWRAVRGRILPLLGLTLLSAVLGVLTISVAVLAIVAAVFLVDSTPLAVVLGIVLVPAAIVAVVWLQVRLFLLASPALVLERIGVFASVRRSYALTRQQFWRTFGIYLLTSLVVGLAGGLLGIPFSLLATVGGMVVPGAASGLVYVLSTYVGLVLTRAVTTPFTSSVIALQYVDQRIRKEGFDIELIASLQPDPAAPPAG